jgi:3-oxoacyl-[acyl-carrier protein] reductase
MALDLAGKVAVVTGAAGTLGLAAARALLEDGAGVALVDIDALRLDGLARFLRGPCLPVPCDASDPHAVRAAHEQVRRAMGPVDILVCAAGASADAGASATDDAMWGRVLGSRVDGAFFWSRAVLPDMAARRWGRLVFATGLARGTGAADSAADGAVEALAGALAREAGGRGITANAIACAHVQAATTADALTEAQRRQILAAIPAGRFGEPEEFAHAIRFLVSPLAGFVNGETVRLDGGSHLA